MKTSNKRIASLAVAAVLGLSSVSALAAADITWKIKDYITTPGFSGTVGQNPLTGVGLGWGTGHGGPVLSPAYEIVYEQYINGVATGYVISGEDAEHYGLKGFAHSITRPVNWYDSTWPNLQYEEIWADGQYTGLIWPTGARLPESAYKDVRYMWEVGGTHKEVARKYALLNNGWYTDATYPANIYTGNNADVKEENLYFGFDVFEVYADGTARDVEVVLDNRGAAVNDQNPVKANLMVNAANTNTIRSRYTGLPASITNLVNSGNGVTSVLYEMLNQNGAYVGQRTGSTALGRVVEVPVYDYTGFPTDWFEDKIPVTHYFNLTGPAYDLEGNITDPRGVAINAYEDSIASNRATVATLDTNAWVYDVDTIRHGFYTNNLITTHATAKADAKWVYAGYELEAPYRNYEYLSLDDVLFDGDIDNNGVLDTPVIFRYTVSGTANITSPVGTGAYASGLFNPGTISYGLADPKIEWRYAFVETDYPHEIMEAKFVENMVGEMVFTGEMRGIGQYAKENVVSNINTNLIDGIEPAAKHYQMRLEWRDNDAGRTLFVSPYFDVNEHTADYIEISASADPDYIGQF